MAFLVRDEIPIYLGTAAQITETLEAMRFPFCDFKFCPRDAIHEFFLEKAETRRKPFKSFRVEFNEDAF